MNPHTDSETDILLHFAMEADPGKETLDRYLDQYSHMAGDLIELSRKLLAEDSSPNATGPNLQDEALIKEAWQRYRTALAKQETNPFESLTVTQQREIANSLSIPRSVFTAIRDRMVLEASIPRVFLRKIASVTGSTLEELSRFLASAPEIQSAQSYKATERPRLQGQVTFEQILIQTNTPAEVREKLLNED